MNAGEIKTKIMEHGYWEIVLKPAKYPDEKVTDKQLRNWLKKHQVRYRGWYYPHFAKGINEYYNAQESYMESYVHHECFLEVFRFYQSGQFIQYMGIKEDRLDPESLRFTQWTPTQRPPSEQHYLDLTMTLYQLTEIFLFAAKLAADGVFSDQAQISIKIHGTNHRSLRFRNFIPSLDEYECHAEPIILEPVVISPEGLKTEHNKLAIDAVVKILTYFDFTSEHIEKILEVEQTEFYNRGPFNY